MYTEWLHLAGISALGPQQHTQQQTATEDTERASDILDATTHELKLDKSNVLLLGPTGSGQYPTMFLISCSTLRSCSTLALVHQPTKTKVVKSQLIMTFKSQLLVFFQNLPNVLSLFFR